MRPIVTKTVLSGAGAPGRAVFGPLPVGTLVVDFLYHTGNTMGQGIDITPGVMSFVPATAADFAANAQFLCDATFLAVTSGLPCLKFSSNGQGNPQIAIEVNQVIEESARFFVVETAEAGTNDLVSVRLMYPVYDPNEPSRPGTVKGPTAAGRLSRGPNVTNRASAPMPIQSFPVTSNVPAPVAPFGK